MHIFLTHAYKVCAGIFIMGLDVNSTIRRLQLLAAHAQTVLKYIIHLEYDTMVDK